MKLVEFGNGATFGYCHRHQHVLGQATHCSNVANVADRGLISKICHCRRGEIKVNAFHKQVCGEKEKAATIHADNGGVIFADSSENR